MTGLAVGLPTITVGNGVGRGVGAGVGAGQLERPSVVTVDMVKAAATAVSMTEGSAAAAARLDWTVADPAGVVADLKADRDARREAPPARRRRINGDYVHGLLVDAGDVSNRDFEHLGVVRQGPNGDAGEFDGAEDHDRCNDGRRRGVAVCRRRVRGRRPQRRRRKRRSSTAAASGRVGTCDGLVDGRGCRSR